MLRLSGSVKSAFWKRVHSAFPVTCTHRYCRITTEAGLHSLAHRCHSHPTNCASGMWLWLFDCCVFSAACSTRIVYFGQLLSERLKTKQALILPLPLLSHRSWLRSSYAPSPHPTTPAASALSQHAACGTCCTTTGVVWSHSWRLQMCTWASFCTTRNGEVGALSHQRQIRLDTPACIL